MMPITINSRYAQNACFQHFFTTRIVQQRAEFTFLNLVGIQIYGPFVADGPDTCLYYLQQTLSPPSESMLHQTDMRKEKAHTWCVVVELKTQLFFTQK